MLLNGDNPMEWIVENWIPAVGAAVIGGDAMVGKSRFINAIIAARSAKHQGKIPKFPFKVRPGVTLLASLEHAKIAVARGLIAAAKAEDIAPTSLMLHTMRPPFNIFDPMHVEQLIEECIKVNADLLVLDSFRRLGDFEENSSDDMRRVMDILQHQLTGEGTANPRCVIALHHLNKASKQLRGSTDLKAGTDTQIIMQANGGGMLHLAATHHDCEPTEAVMRVTRDGIWELANTTAKGPSLVSSHLFDALASAAGKPMTTTDLVQALRQRGQTIEPDELEVLLQDLGTGSQVTHLDGKGRKARWTAAKA
jgi:hypothetical protein